MSRFKLIPPAALIAGALLSGAWLLGRALDRDARRHEEGARLLDAVMAKVRDTYVEEVDEETLWQGAIAGMMDQLGDPNSAYLTPDRLERLNLAASNAYRGVGLSVEVLDGWITVTLPRPGSPAERAGLQTGDRLVELDGKSMRGWTVGEAREALRGPLGSTVKLVVERGQGTRIPVTLERADIRSRAVTRATVLDGNVGYVAVTTFSDSTEAELISIVDSLRASGAQSLVLDLRGNPGGLLEQGIGVADLFLAPDKQIVTTRGRVADANQVYVDSTRERWAGMPIAVLVNANTASAAEIVAGALQDNDRAVVLGRVTYGKGSAQVVYPLENGAAISLTQARWFTPLGRSLEVAPPDEEPLVDVDTARPVFRTASGRRVYGGGGIVPDITAGDSVPDPAERRFLAEVGADVPKWREMVTAEARALVQSRSVRDSLFTVRPEWKRSLKARVRAAGIRVTSATFDEASAFVERALGNEIARQGWGVPYAQRRAVRADAVVLRAAELLRKARAPMDVFATE
jgi:carboxyl-terminal processing protease